MRRRPLLALGLLLAASCSGLDPEEEQRVEDYLNRAIRYYDAGDLARAEQQARLGLELDPENGELYHVLGRTLLRREELKLVARAKAPLEKAYELKPDYRTAWSLGEFHLRYAEFLLGSVVLLEDRIPPLELRGDQAGVEDLRRRAEHQRRVADEHLHEALELLSSSLAEAQDQPYVLRLLANCQSHLGRDAEALQTLDTLIQNLIASRRFKNQQLALQDLSVAEELMWRRVLETDIRMEIEAHGLAAAIHKRNQNYAAAIEHLDEILKLDPERVPEYFNRGMCHYWLGQIGRAVADMQTFIRKTSLSMDSEEVSRALDIIAEYRARSPGTAAASPAGDPPLGD